MHILLTPLAQATTLAMAAICIAAMVFGRWPERVGAVVVAIDWLGGALVQDRSWHHHGQPGVLAFDLGMLAFLIWMALACRRTWVLWAAACSLLLVATNLMLLLDDRLMQWSYVTAMYVWGLGVLLSLGAGAAVEGRRPAGPAWSLRPAQG